MQAAFNCFRKLLGRTRKNKKNHGLVFGKFLPWLYSLFSWRKNRFLILDWN